MTKKHVLKGGLPAFRCYSLTLVDTQKLMEKVVLASESLFRPANGVRSTRLLVEIHNKYGQDTRKKTTKRVILPKIHHIQFNSATTNYFFIENPEIFLLNTNKLP